MRMMRPTRRPWILDAGLLHAGAGTDQLARNALTYTTVPSQRPGWESADGEPQSSECHGPHGRGHVREPIVRQPAGPAVPARRGAIVRGGPRQGPHQPRAGVGRARCGGWGRALRGVAEHELAVARPGRGAPPHHDTAVRDPGCGQPVRAPARGDVQHPDRCRPDAVDGWVPQRLHQHVRRGDGSPAHLRRVRPAHDRLHPGADACALRHRPWLRHLRPLVLRRAVVHVPEPVVLPRRDVVRATS